MEVRSGPNRQSVVCIASSDDFGKIQYIFIIWIASFPIAREAFGKGETQIQLK